VGIGLRRAEGDLSPWPSTVQGLPSRGQEVLSQLADVVDLGGRSQRGQTRSLIVSTTWALVMWGFFGAHALVLTDALGGRSLNVALICVGAFALAWVVGLLVVIAPAGAGAREAVLVLALGSVLDRPEALVLALVSRIIMVLADAVVAGAAAPDLLLRRRAARKDA
jgi:uncharacterized membrane protein YbhN (UPF0104 family)